MGRIRENCRDFARVAAVGVGHRTGPVERDVAGRLGPKLRRIGLERRTQIRDRVQFLIADRDQLGRILRRREALGDHQRDRLAAMHHAVARKRRTERHDELAAVAAGERRMHRT